MCCGVEMFVKCQCFKGDVLCIWRPLIRNALKVPIQLRFYTSSYIETSIYVMILFKGKSASSQ